MKTRKMLYISIQLENSRPYLQFEIEDYYEETHRMTYAEHSFKELTKEAIAEDVVSLDRVSMWIFVGLLPYSVYTTRRGVNRALVLYESQFRNPQRIGLKIDEEDYRDNPDRVVLGRMPMNTIDPDSNIHVPLMRMRLGMQLVKYLPLP